MMIVLAKRLACSIPASELQPLLGVNQRSQALKELGSLVAYPIFFFLLLIPVFINRLYSSITSNIDFASFLASGIAIPAIGLFSGMTLIFHVVVLKKPKLSKQILTNYSIGGDQRVISHADTMNSLRVINKSEE